MSLYAKYVLPRIIDLAMSNRETRRLRAGWIPHAASDIKVFPVPHSAITAALRSVSHFFAIPIAATAWAGNGRRSRVARREDTGSHALCSAG